MLPTILLTCIALCSVSDVSVSPIINVSGDVAVTRLPIMNIRSIQPSLGGEFRTLTKAEAARLGITGGVIVTAIRAGGTLSNQTKMHVGFVITSIGNFPVTSVEGLNAILGRQKSQFVIQGMYPGSKQIHSYSIHRF